MGIMVLNCVTPITAATVGAADLGALADSYEAGSGTFTLTENSRLFVVAESEPTGELLQTVQLAQQQLVENGYLNSKSEFFVWGKEDLAKDGDIVVKLDASSDIATEGYELNVTSIDVFK